ncbi:MAG: tRNA dihydrouridine synthase DusB [Gammaproteobacteria bacterium]|nr:MAG: tRNA dihydrouridine synthase DusB [Gammaproteobacteria bacterium]
MQIGNIQLKNNLIFAPMAGISDLPTRKLMRKFGAGLAVSEMVSSNSLLYGSKKTARRADLSQEDAPTSVQIMGTVPQMMADAVMYNIDKGADIIDINMGCPAKKVCNVMAGAALMRDEKLVEQILNAVIKKSSVPITLKIRLGWDDDHINAQQITMIAENCGVSAITIHGRTRAQGYSGEANYDEVAKIKQKIKIPIIANGDINSAQKAQYVLEKTKVDALMIGRAAMGNPWIFKNITHFLQHNEILPKPTIAEIREILLEHLQQLYQFYGEYMGVMMARKHISWYSKSQKNSATFRQKVNKIKNANEQQQAVDEFFNNFLL